MISLNWIKDYVNIDGIDPKELASKITKAGINVEHVISQKIDNLVVGEITKCTSHPDSDHLHICDVNIGDKIVQIICGASNVREGLKVITALPGAILPGNFEIKISKIRGVESNGMLCALFELGLEEKTEETYNKGITELPNDAIVGTDPLAHLGLDDTLYELDLNPNRFDCNNHLSFAYEIGAILDRPVTMPCTKTNPIPETNDVTIDIATENCYMYNAKVVKDVTIKESPDFIKQRLINAGMRPINNVVDISNYVMLEYGQPLHFFDKAKLGSHIKVRMANDNEEIITLDNQKRILNKDDIVITDGDKPVCISGVMGWFKIEVDENTIEIVIESAIFNPYNVRYTSLNLNLRSEASLRYEKGLNYEYCNLAIERACHLLEKYADGKVLTGTTTYDNIDKKEKIITVTKKQINSLLGMHLTNEEIEEQLRKLSFPYQKEKDTYHVSVPPRRLDIGNYPADIIEEVGRLYGYDTIKAQLPILPTKTGVYAPKTKFRKDISKHMRSLGLNEVRTYTLISEEENKEFNRNPDNSIHLLRPLIKERSIIRTTIISSLLKSINYNIGRKNKDIMLYEIANVYDKDYYEETKLAFALHGNYLHSTWQNNNNEIDYYLTKGIVENLLDYLGLTNRYTFRLSDNLPKEIHPKVNSEIIIDNEVVGYIGKVHPMTSKYNIYVGEISLDKLYAKKVRSIKFKELNKYPVITKDLAFIIDSKVTSDEITKVIKKAGGRLLTNIEVFDVYHGDKLETNQKSIAFHLTFEDNTKTLTDDEINILFNKIITDVTNKCHAILRDN